VRVDGNWAYEARLNNGIPFTTTRPRWLPLFTGGRTKAEIVKSICSYYWTNKGRFAEPDCAGCKDGAAQSEIGAQSGGSRESGRATGEEEVDQARDRFKAGVANNIEVIRAQDALARANDNQIAAQPIQPVARGLCTVDRRDGNSLREVRQRGPGG
jgi:hypothetical protein